MSKKNILKRKIEVSDVVRMAGIAVFIGLVAWAAVLYTRSFGEVTAADGAGNFLQNLQASGIKMKDYIAVQYPKTGLLIMLFLQILHVVVSAIPAAIISFASGMVYGMWGGMLISIVGTAMGTAVSFYLARLLGRRVLTLFVSEKNIAKMEKMIDGNTSTFVLLVLFIIPSPKDFFSYFIGLTNMKASKYFLISAAGRIPGMLITTYLGTVALNQDPNYALIIGCTVFAVVVSIFSFTFKNKIMALLNKIKKTPEEAPSC
jgi:uncharacterized membrane protein YdjX (TVP38/TMEM64 family)